MKIHTAIFRGYNNEELVREEFNDFVEELNRQGDDYDWMMGRIKEFNISEVSVTKERDEKGELIQIKVEYWCY
jgi:hypothetical protein